jgi:rhodanese-related sulfurtransferase
MFGMASEREVSATEAYERLGTEGHILVDVRSPAEVAASGVAGAVNIPLELLEQAAEQLAAYPSIHLLCRSGARSGMACTLLADRGVPHAKNVAGGLIAWHAAGLPLR